eukprot:scaffold186696_cov32-Tisochrysis_lutea.AAC.2
MSSGSAGGKGGTGGGGEGGQRFLLVSAASRRRFSSRELDRLLLDHTCVPGAVSCCKAKVTSAFRMGNVK